MDGRQHKSNRSWAWRAHVSDVEGTSREQLWDVLLGLYGYERVDEGSDRFRD
jgi:hypothetical protein